MRRAAVVLVVGIGSCAPAPEATARTQQPIYGGVPAPDDAAVFFIHDDVSACTASLIAPRTLLTARHCINQGTIIATNPPSSDASYSGLEAVTWTDVHRDGGDIVDLALVFLDRAPPIAPLQWDWTTFFPAAGTPVRHIGYGATETGGGGERRTVGSVTQFMLYDPMSGNVVLSGTPDAGVCYGDSGGPMLLEDPDGGPERLLAVNVRLAAPTCGPVASVMVPWYRVFIEDWLRTHEDAGCPRDDRCVGGCSPQADPDCVAPGAVCSTPLQCPERRCVNDPQHSDAYCAVPCAGGCPGGFQCDAAKDACIIAQKPEASLGEACVDGETFCRSSTCLEGKCRTACSDDSACTVAGEHCRQLAPRYCAPPVVVSAIGFDHPARGGCSAVGGLVPLLALGWLLARRRVRAAAGAAGSLRSP